jgi:CRISPR system Cascade subunit CasE
VGVGLLGIRFPGFSGRGVLSWLVHIELETEVLAQNRIHDSYDWHQRLWECFPDKPNSARDFLTRIDLLDGSVRVWMLAGRQPISPAWCPPNAFAVKEVSPEFLSHTLYAFDLRANPTKALVQRAPDGTPKRKANGKRASGKRVPLVKLEDLRAWIERKGVEAGFRISAAEPLDIGPMVENHFRRKETRGLHGGVQFRGVLEVVDPTKFRDAYFRGIGPAKAFGFGLLLLAPIQQ